MMALHGFLGQPADWNGILDDEWEKPNWLSGLERQSDLLPTLAAKLNANAKTKDLLLGYSMGGRIALHMLIQAPLAWKGAMIISASPGLSEQEDRQARIKSDHRWAERFLHDDWSETVTAWNAQPVFAHDPPDQLPRLEKDFSRTSLAAALIDGSVATQLNLRDPLRQLNVPILWVAGENDPKYVAIATESAALNPLFTLAILPKSGHRAPWGNPESLKRALKGFKLTP